MVVQVCFAIRGTNVVGQHLAGLKLGVKRELRGACLPTTRRGSRQMECKHFPIMIMLAKMSNRLEYQSFKL